jgi:N-acetylglucosaminyl-diphospho-decaprenol L-rhamnosyltransferase
MHELPASGMAMSGGRLTASQRRQAGFGRGYVLRRYGVLRGRYAVRAVLTEALVVLGDMLVSHDLVALDGRLAGWRAGRSSPRMQSPPAECIDRGIGVLDALAMRRGRCV